MKIRMAEAIQEYNNQYDQLTGKDHNLGDDSEWKQTQDNLERSEHKIGAVQKALDKLTAHRDKLLAKKAELDLLPDVAKIQAQQTKAQGELSSLQSKLNKLSVKSFSNQLDTINTKIKDTTERFSIAAKQAASLKFVDEDSENWDKLSKFVQEQDTINKEQDKTLTNTIANLKLQEQELQDRLNTALSKRRTKNNNEIIDSLTTQLNDTKAELDRAVDKLNILSVNQKLVKDYKKSMKQAFDTQGSDYSGGGFKNRKSLKQDNNWQIAQQSRLETFAIDKNTKVIPDSVIADLERQKQQIKEKILAIKEERKKALKGTNEKNKIGLELENTDTHISKANAEMKRVTTETANWRNRLKEVEAEILYLEQEMAKLQGDANINPTETEFESDAMKPFNQDLDEANRKWGAMGGFMSRAKAKLAGIKGYMKQTTIFTRIWHKVWQNIYSQIASLINPLNVFKRAWNDWINRAENKAWANTFDVIKYNLVTVIAPLLEWCANLALKFFAVVNVFTKKWAGVDLFDKSAWQLDKIKKGMGQLTASFDELHSSTDNPDENNTMFDKGIDPNSLISDDLKAKLEGWADNIAKAFAKVKEWWSKAWNWIKEHPILAALGAITLGALLNKLGLGGLLGKLCSWVFKGLWGLVKGAWNIVKWLGPKIWSGIKWVAGKLTDPNTWKSVGTFFKGIGTKLSTFLGKGLYTGMNGATVTMGKFLGGVAMVAGGTILAGKSAIDAGKNWMDYNNTQKAVRIGGVALGSAMAGVGAVLLGASGPVGWAVAGAVALGAFCVGMAQTQDGIGSVKDETEKWQAANEKLQQANQNLYQANENYIGQLGQLEALERQTGESGEALFKAVRDGKMSVDDMTAAQLQVYNAYVNTKKAADDLAEAQRIQKEAAAEEAEAAIRVEIANAKKSKSYDEVARSIKDSWEKGTISTEKARELMERAMGGMSEDARKEFMEKFPGYITEGLNPEKYQSGWRKLGSWFSTKFSELGNRLKGEWTTVGNSIADGWKEGGVAGAVKGFFSGLDRSTANSINELYNLKATEDDLKKSSEELAVAQQKQAEQQAKVNDLEKKTGQSASDLYGKIKDNSIAYNDLTEDEKLLVNEYYNLQQAMKTTDECALNNVKNMASIDLQAAQTSGDYTTFIDNLIAANERGEIDTQEMQTLMAQAYANLDYDAKQTFMEKIPENMRQGIEDSSKEYQGKWSQLGDWLRGCWEGIKGKAQEWWGNISGTIGGKVEEIKTKAVTKFNELKDKAKDKWEEIKGKASEKWEQIKNSAIGQKVKEIYTNTKSKFDEIKNTLSTQWETLKTKASTAWNNIKSSIVNAAKGAWEKAKGWFNKIGEGIKNAWEGLKGLGERIGNGITGKGWKTNSEIASYAVGTNYVPNDQLAYIHKGEAVVPAKYNKPYRGTAEENGDTRLLDSVNQLTNQVRQMQEVVNQGIRVQGQFVQRGSDLVATVERATNKMSNSVLNNKVYAR